MLDLVVDYFYAEPANNVFSDSGDMAWRVCFRDCSGLWAINIPYQRRIDAEAGMEVAKTFFMGCETKEAIRERCSTTDEQRKLRIAMTECLQW